ncbi:hypothetical protein JTB14_008707 [Gonioctena quinquepunctata]|nr:hypothetical protein JTB14_008707 [Gonioctena quinquepunctata]
MLRKAMKANKKNHTESEYETDKSRREQKARNSKKSTEEEDVPIQHITLAVNEAAKEHWTKYYTGERQAELDACNKSPKEITKQKRLVKRESITDIIEASNQFQALSDEEISKPGEESNTENETNSQLRGRQKKNQITGPKMMPAIIINSLFAIDKPSSLRWKEKYQLERDLQWKYASNSTIIYTFLKK